MVDYLNAIVQGLLLGGLYALFAVGLSLVFGTMRLTNLAHGAMIILAAYVALKLVDTFHFNPFYSIPVTMVIMFIFGYLLQRGVLNWIVRGGEIAGVIVTFGLLMIIQNGLQQYFSADDQSLRIGWSGASIKLTSGVFIGWLPLTIFLIAVVVIVGLQIFLSRTRMGRAFRAVSDDQEAARMMGINNRHIWGTALGVALMIAAIGGVMFGINTSFTPTLGNRNLIFAFEAVIIGGMGSIWGTLLGGVVLGLAQTLGGQVFGGRWDIFCGHIVFLLILALKPQGLLAKTVQA